MTNPQVGAVLVHQDRIIGEGYHKKFGGPHAEVNCLNSVADSDQSLIHQSTIYVSLEPCCIVSKTPACTNAIIKAQIPRVVISITDPDSRVAGRSQGILEEAGIEVVAGVSKSEGYRLIAPFRAHLAGRPYVILKWAQSADGYIGKKGQQVWLSDQYSQMKSHQWRSEVDAILVGKSTVIVDNPELTTRLVPGSNPLRVVLGSDLDGMSDSSIMKDAYPSLLALTQPGGDSFSSGMKEVLYLDSGEIISELLSKLFEQGINYLMVEGGAKVHKSFVEAGLWDEARIIKTTKIIKRGIRAASVTGQLVREQKLGKDLIAYIHR